MLGKNSLTPRQANSGDMTVIGTECQITGNVIIKGNARIDGRIEGNVQATGDLTIGQGALVQASIEAKTIVIAGEVRGDVIASDTLELNASARLYGDIATRQLKVEQGARFVGSSKSLDDSNGLNQTTGE